MMRADILKILNDNILTVKDQLIEYIQDENVHILLLLTLSLLL